MNVKVDFIGKKFNSLLFTTTFSMAASSILILIDSVIVGQMFGEEGIAGVSLVESIVMVGVFLAMLIEIGTGFCFSSEIGAYRKKEAHLYFSQGLVCVIVIGLFMFLLMFFGENMYFSFLGATDNLLQYGKAYYKYAKYYVMVLPIFLFLVKTICADGDEKACIGGYVMQVFGNIVLSIILGKVMGIEGVSLGTFIGTFLGTLILCTHFLKKKNSLKFIKGFSFEKLKNTIKYSLVDAELFLCWGLLSLVVNKIVIERFGEFYVPIVALLNLILGFTMVFDGIEEAVKPLHNLLVGEGNVPATKRLMKKATRYAFVEGIIFTVVLCVGARLFPLVLDFQDEKLIEISVKIIRIYSITAVFTSFLFVYTTYYEWKEYGALSISIIFLKDFVFPVVLSIVMPKSLGITGIGIAYLVAPFLAFVIGVIVAICKFGYDSFPYLLKKEYPTTYNYDIKVNQDEILALRDKVNKDLTNEKICESSVNKIMMLIEDGYMKMINVNKSEVVSQFTIFIKDDVEVVMKDNGVVNDMVNEKDNLTSFRDYFVSSVVGSLAKKQYIMATSFNRNVYNFPKK